MLCSSLHDAVVLGIFMLIHTNCKSLTHHFCGRHIFKSLLFWLSISWSCNSVGLLSISAVNGFANNAKPFSLSLKSLNRTPNSSEVFYKASMYIWRWLTYELRIMFFRVPRCAISPFFNWLWKSSNFRLNDWIYSNI